MIFKSVFPILLLITCFFSYPAKGVNLLQANNAKKLLLTKSSSHKSFSLLKAKKRKNPYSPSEFTKDKPQAKGIILTFHRWPNKRETALILRKLRRTGLKKTSEIKRFKVWIFEWQKWKNGKKAKKICKTLSKLSILKYCEPDYLAIPI